MRRIILYAIVLCTLSGAIAGKQVEKGDKKSRDPYIQVMEDMKRLSAELGNVKGNEVVDKHYYFSGNARVMKSSKKGDKSVNYNIHTDFLFNTYKIWNEMFDMSQTRSIIKNKLTRLSNIMVGNHGYFLALFFAILIIEIAYKFYSGTLTLESLLYTMLYGVAIYVVLQNYNSVFAQVDRGFKELVAYLITPSEWKKATQALMAPLFSFSAEGNIVTGGFSLFNMGALLSMAAKIIISGFVYITLYFVYLPAITLPPLITNILIMGLFLIGKFILILSVLSLFRGLLKNYLTFLFAMELYLLVFAVLTTAVGNAVSSSMHQVLQVDNFFKASLNWLETIIFIGPLSILFLVLDVVSYNVVRGILTGMSSSPGFFGAAEAKTSMIGIQGIKDGVGFISTGGKVVGSGTHIVVDAGKTILEKAPSPVPDSFTPPESPSPRS